MDEFAYLIPLDCRTSTPVAARKRTLKGLLGSGGGGKDLADINPSPPRISPPRRKRMSPGVRGKACKERKAI
jgi:hypothetical protein